jgi:hypothetical protein
VRLQGLAAGFTTMMVDSCFAAWPAGWVSASQCGQRGGSLLRGSANGQVSASRRGQWGGSLVGGGGGWPHRLWNFFVCCCWIVYKSLDLCCCWLFWACFQICVVVVVLQI